MNTSQKPTINVLKTDEFGELFTLPVSGFQPLKSTGGIADRAPGPTAGVPPMPHEPQGEAGQRSLGIMDTPAGQIGQRGVAAKRMSEVVGDAPALANRKAPYYYVQQEKPHHRVFLELAAKGYAVKEIAEMTGFTPVCVNNILRQPHTQQFLVNEIRDIYSVDEEVVTVIKDNAVAAVQALANIIHDENSKGSDRIAAANALLDRRYGKPNQPINRGTDVDLNTLTDDELAAMLPTKGTGTTGISTPTGSEDWAMETY